MFNIYFLVDLDKKTDKIRQMSIYGIYERFQCDMPPDDDEPCAVNKTKQFKFKFKFLYPILFIYLFIYLSIFKK
jgi:hypothetical protein